MERKPIKKALTSMILAFIMLISLLPTIVFAEGTSNITVYYDNSTTNWSKVSLYYWGVSGSTWPGTEMSKVEGKDNIYSITIPSGVTGIIFNDGGNGSQSTDVVDIQDGATYKSIGTEGGKQVVLKEDANGNVKGEPTVDQITDDMKQPKQVNIHVGTDYSTVNVTYTTLAKVDTKISIKKAGDATATSYSGTNRFSLVALKYYNTISVTGLEASTKYEYTIGEGKYSYNGSFTTAPKTGSKDSFKFAFIADTQVANATDAKALGATFNEINQLNNLGFVYMAGDITDNSTNETAWENLYVNSGKFSTAGQDMFGNNLIAVTQGNHDISTFTGHINAPNQAGEDVYSFDYGPAKFIILNLESAKNSDSIRETQKSFLEAQVAKAKEAGQWTIVGFHKSIYTGASHITDDDVIAARKYWGPTLAGLDVDLVLMGHDHVYSRGFVNANGENAKLTKNADGSYSSLDNAPLYMVGGHAGGLKWYSKKAYTVSAGDPLTPNYAFLDKDSDDDGGDVKKEQTYTVFEVSNDSITLNAYNLKYDTNSDIVTTQKYLYDTLTLKRNVKDTDNQTPLSVTGKANLKSPQGAATEIKLTAKATGGTGKYTYRFVVLKDGKVKRVRGYLSANSTRWIPTEGGKYVIYYMVKDSEGNECTQTQTYEINSDNIKRFEQNDSSIKYSGSWYNGKNVLYSSNSTKKTESAGATASFTFKGTGLNLFGTSANNKGIAKVEVDGIEYKADYYSSYTRYNNNVFSVYGLYNTSHNVVIKYTADKNSKSNGTSIDVDAIEIIK